MQSTRLASWLSSVCVQAQGRTSLHPALRAGRGHLLHPRLACPALLGPTGAGQRALMAASRHQAPVQLVTSEFLSAEDIPACVQLHLILLNYVLPPQTASLWQRAATRICADGGANRLFDQLPGMLPGCGADTARDAHLPDLIKGDLDSVRPDVREYYTSRGVPFVDLSSDQDTTDLEKCLLFLEGRLRSLSAEAAQQQQAAAAAAAAKQQQQQQQQRVLTLAGGAGRNGQGHGAKAIASAAAAAAAAAARPSSSSNGGRAAALGVDCSATSSGLAPPTPAAGAALAAAASSGGMARHGSSSSMQQEAAEPPQQQQQLHQQPQILGEILMLTDVQQQQDQPLQQQQQQQDQPLQQQQQAQQQLAHQSSEPSVSSWVSQLQPSPDAAAASSHGGQQQQQQLVAHASLAGADAAVDAEHAAKRMRQEHLILVMGALGGRLDHTLSNLNTLYCYPHLNITLWGDGNLVRLLRAGRSVIRPSRVEGPTCGLVPLARPATASSSGLKWDLSDTHMCFRGLLSTSNIIASDTITVTSDEDLLWITAVGDGLDGSSSMAAAAQQAQQQRRQLQ